MVEAFDREKFAQAVGSKFKVTAENGNSVDVELIQVTPWTERRNQRSFSALFGVPEGYFVEQGMYDFEHAEMGPMQLFVVPVGPINGMPALEALFNFVVREDKSVSG